MDASFEALQQENVCQVTLSGELTIYTVETQKAQLLESLDKCQQMELDLHQVEELDTAGLQLLLLLQHAVIQAEKTLKLVCPSEAVLEVFSLLKMDKHFDISPSINSVSLCNS